MSDLAKKKCVPCEGGDPALDLAAASSLKAQIDNRWKLAKEGKLLHATFKFDNYWQTTSFINAVAWIAHTQDHHPDISFGYNSATIEWWTHAVGGLSKNDFICAARVDELLN